LLGPAFCGEPLTNTALRKNIADFVHLIKQFMKNKYLTFLFIFISMIALNYCAVNTQLKSASHRTVSSLKARDFYLRGLFLQNDENYDGALVAYYQALQYDSSSVAIRNNIAECYIQKNEYESARHLLNEALIIDGTNLESLKLQADSYFLLKKDRKAIEIYQKILKLEPYHEESRKILLFLLERNGDHLELAKQYEALLGYYGYDEKTSEKLAQIYLEQREYEQGINVFKKIAAQNQENIHALYSIAYIYETIQTMDSAAVYYQKAISLRNDYIPAYERLSMIYRMKRDWRKIIALYEPPLMQNNEDMIVTASLMTAEALIYLEEFSEAKALLNTIINRPDLPWGIWDLLGRIEVEIKNYSLARHYFKKITKLNLKNSFPWLYIAFTYTRENQLDSANVVYREALQHFPSNPVLLANYGINLQAQEKYFEAVRPLEKALSIDSTNINSLSALPVIYEKLGFIAKSDRLYEIGISRLPANDLLLNNYAYSLSERDTLLERALKMSQKAVAMAPENGAYLDTIGWIYFKLNQFQEAEKYIKKAIKHKENSAVVFEHLGDVYYKMQQIELAIIQWQTALKLEPNKQTLIQKLENVK
jgi:tetratricopeptide (TPR) repeat protein